jgi:hypothetical protein
MLVAIWCRLAWSAIVVSFVSHESTQLLEFDLARLGNLVPQVAHVIAFVHDPASSSSINARDIFQRSIPLFPSELIFVELDAEDARNLTSSLRATAPHLLFYRNGSLWAHYSFPTGEFSFLRLMRLYLMGPRHPATTKTELYRSLGASYFAFIFPSDQTLAALSLHIYGGGIFGFMDLIPFSVPHAEGLGLNPTQFYLFRHEDMALEPIDANLSSIVPHISPRFQRFAIQDLVYRSDLTFGIVTDRFTPQVSSILGHVSDKFSGFSIGYIERPLHAFVNASISGTLEEVPAFAMFNVTGGIYYPIPDDLNQQLKNGSSDVFGALDSFLSNLPAPVEVSEILNKENSDKCERLVGSTHDAFVNDSNSDAVVLYFSRQGQETRRFQRLIEKVSESLKQEHVGTVKFGMINVTANSARFPSFVQLPHIEIYPAANKSDHRAFFARPSLNSILAFIRNYGSTKISGTFGEESVAEMNFERRVLSRYLQFATSEDSVKASERLKVLTERLNSTQVKVD